MATEKRFSENEALAMMHQNTAQALEKIADHIEAFDLGTSRVVELLRDFKEEILAQAHVCQVRDMINNKP